MDKGTHPNCRKISFLTRITTSVSSGHTKLMARQRVKVSTKSIKSCKIFLKTNLNNISFIIDGQTDKINYVLDIWVFIGKANLNLRF